ncbi:L,D-transpeptidase [Chondromyces crocatus]|uniref:L,D-transpeptidase n=1 Tax=Chondromyces crocatus TaxID=52 RepID=UPI0012E262AC|nr:L,D-transpeptidase [Chondromyces crocatus]
MTPDQALESPARRSRLVTALTLCGAALALPACNGGEHASAEGIVSLSSPASNQDQPDDPAKVPRPDGPRIGAVQMTAIVYERPDRRAPKLGYLRAGGTTVRAEKPVALDDCQGGWYRVLPAGYMCAEGDASIDMKHPILRALTVRPALDKPMPYPYAFVRAIAPNYYRVPSKDEQLRYEMSLERHLRSYKKLKTKWDEFKVGANDVPIDELGQAIGEPPETPPDLSDSALFGGNGEDAIPWFFKGGRQIPNIASFKVPPYAVITNRIARKAGLALIGSFVGPNDRRFALTTDARLVPTSKLKPARGSVFHGVDMNKGWELPLAFVHKEGAHKYDLSKAALDKNGKLPWHTAVQLTGKSKFVGKTRLVEAKEGYWVRDADVAIAVKPSELPPHAKGNTRWIDISILNQVVILYEGPKPVYATAAATGRDGLADPKTTFSTVRGTFRIREKHVTTTMDSHESGNKFELRDVPWVQYFEAGYAIHASPWHDDYGRPRSHGCINLSPIDARRVFMWTDPPVPADWHGANSGPATGEGTIVHIHP